MNATIKNTSAIILAGGVSSRMGEDKRSLTLKGKSLVSISIDIANSFTEDIIISSNDELEDFIPHKVIPDQINDSGPVMAIISTLGHIRYNQAIILTCDMPFVTLEVLTALLTKRGNGRIRFPYNKGITHPFPSLFPVSVLPDLIKAYNSGIHSMKGIIKNISSELIVYGSVGSIDHFINLNRPDDYKKAMALLGD